MRKFIKAYFSFTRSEARIVFMLSCFLVILLFFRFSGRSHIEQPYKPTENELKIIREFIASFESDEKNQETSRTSGSLIFYNNLKKFDPNKVVVNEMEKMGFPGRVINNIVKYRNSGGYFKFPEDIRKIYGLTDTAYQLLRPYIEIEGKKADPENKNNIDIELAVKYEPLNINIIDSIQLAGLPGIGSGLALRIIKFRERLGGFCRPEQLLEVYGLDTGKYNLLKDKIYIDNTDIRKISINKYSYKELIRHPYIDEELALSIIKFREFRGLINDAQELYLYNIITIEKMEKLEAYLNFESPGITP